MKGKARGVTSHREGRERRGGGRRAPGGGRAMTSTQGGTDFCCQSILTEMNHLPERVIDNVLAGGGGSVRSGNWV